MKLEAIMFFFAKKISPKLGIIVPAGLKKRIKDRIIKKSILRYINKDKISYKKGIYKGGVNLIGGIKAEMGLGQSCRLIAYMLKEAKFSLSIYNYDFAGAVSERDSSFDEYIMDDLPHEINIFHVNPYELGELFMKRRDAWNGRYNIAFWLWELEEFPKEWKVYCQLFDEIWTPSEFASRAMAKVTDVPIRVLPYAILAQYDKNIRRKDFFLPEDKFLFLVMYDANSTEGRKNPQGAIKAYKKAFASQNQDVGLVIKVNNANDSQLKALKLQLEEYRNIYYMTETLDKRTVNSLIKCVDVYVSLHRAEGFGLVMAEAMLLETPVIATNWSANIEFMDEDSACMVDYKLVENPKTEGLYKKDCIWAEPNYNQASAYMKRLWEDKEYYLSKKGNGKAYIENKLNEERLVNLLKKYIDNIMYIK